MKFPEASAWDKANEGWEIDVNFLEKVMGRVHAIDKEGLICADIADIETVLLAAQQVMEEQEAEACRHVQGLEEVLASRQESIDIDFQKTVDIIVDEMIAINPFSLGGK